MRPALTFETPDSLGYVPNKDIVGQDFQHYKGDVYTVSGYEWDATNDLWRIRYHKRGGSGAVKFSRTPEDFFSPGKFRRFA